MRITRKRSGQPQEKAEFLHSGTVRRGMNKGWWVVRRGAWQPLRKPGASKKKTRKASTTWAKGHGMIKVFYNNPESCDGLRTPRKYCLRPPALLAGWHMSNKLRPYSPEHKYTHIDEYIGPLDTMTTMHKLMIAQFKTYLKLGMVLDYDFQVKSMMEKYEGWGRL